MVEQLPLNQSQFQWQQAQQILGLLSSLSYSIDLNMKRLGWSERKGKDYLIKR